MLSKPLQESNFSGPGHKTFFLDSKGNRLIREAIALAVEKKDLSADMMRTVWEEITAAAEVMRSKATRIDVTLSSGTGRAGHE